MRIPAFHSARRRNAVAVISVLAFACTVIASAPVRATPAAWLAGSAAEKITPRSFDATRDLAEFPDLVCPRSSFDGPRLFDHQEPYADRDGDGAFDYTQDLYCDYNHNGRWDGLYGSGGVDHQLEWVHDDIWARAVAISDGSSTVVIESVTSQGLLIEDDLRIRNGIKAARGATEVYVSSTHNESSPDPIGIYGAPDLAGAAGAHSGVDDYYIDFLVAQAIKAGNEAIDALTPAKLRAGEFRPADVTARLSTTFPTTDAISGGTPSNGTPEATADKGRVLQVVRASDDANIETIFNFAAHNQQIGHAGDSVNDPASGKRVNRAVSDDWPGVFATAVEQSLGSGRAMFMVADNGSIEDPRVNGAPAPCPGGKDEGCFALSDATGPRLAAGVVNTITSGLTDIAPHAIRADVDQFYVPLQNQLFIAAFTAGLFAHRTAATVLPCADATTAGKMCFLTEVGLIDFGPQLQMMVNPGEAYPALIEGHPFGMEEMSCPDRPAPPVPAWHAHADFKLQMGLGGDLIGYEIPAPAWFSDPAVLVDPSCPVSAQFFSDPSKDTDRRNEYHKLESESVGPDGGNLVAQHLAALADAASSGNGTSAIQHGRFLMASGAFTRKGKDGPVGMWVLPAGSATFTPGTGTIVALAGTSSFGSEPVAAHGQFMDFDGRAQPAANINTRGMIVTNQDGSVTRYFMDPYPILTGSPPGPAA